MVADGPIRGDGTHKGSAAYLPDVHVLGHGIRQRGADNRLVDPQLPPASEKNSSVGLYMNG